MPRKVVITKDGPYIVSGGLPLAKEIIITDSQGYSIKWSKGESYPNQESYALCRCGNSSNKPHCDGTHLKEKFDGTEIASREKYIKQAGKIVGPKLTLTDAQDLCAFGRFCDRAGGIWDLTKKSNDPKSKEIAIQEGCDCPSGRLVTWDKKANEPSLNPSIGVVEDPEKKVSGPLRLKGGVQLESADGTKYEIRNRVTLCRCGKSGNKPFCNGNHATVGFNDGDKSLK